MMTVRRAGRAFAAVMFVAALACGAVGLGGVLERGAAEDRAVAAAREVEFWRVVDGGAPEDPSTGNRLAVELRDLDTPADWDGFVASASQYAGVEDEIGFSPFASGSQGVLSAYTKARLAQIAAGDFGVVVAELEVSVPAVSWVPFGWSPLVWFGAVWLVGGPLVLWGASRSVPDEALDRVFREDWRAVLLAPLLWVGWRVTFHARLARLRARVGAKFPDQLGLVDELDRVTRGRDGDAAAAARARRDELMAELDVQSRSERRRDEDRLGVLIGDADRSLEVLRVRRAYLDGEEGTATS